jgi:hypothetical protein
MIIELGIKSLTVDIVILVCSNRSSAEKMPIVGETADGIITILFVLIQYLRNVISI